MASSRRRSEWAPAPEKEEEEHWLLQLEEVEEEEHWLLHLEEEDVDPRDGRHKAVCDGVEAIPYVDVRVPEVQARVVYHVHVIRGTDHEGHHLLTVGWPQTLGQK